MDEKKHVVVRFAPSPTGALHIGGARSALFNYLYAQKMNGEFHLRIEDTDRERSKLEFEKNILDGMDWLGIKFNSIVRQSERTEIYKKYLRKLLDDGFVYVSEEKPTKVGDRTSVIRFKNPNKKIKFNDLIRGDIEFDTTELGDFVVAKSENEPLYHLANVVDDIEMGVTHVIRGEDHISNTPRQMLIWAAISSKMPYYAHVPLILAQDRSKLSKRHGAVSVTSYRNDGYLPQALINYLALLGWNPGTNQEIFTLDEIANLFTLEKISKGGAIFEMNKLQWINKEHIKKMTDEQFETEARKYVSDELSNSPLSKKIFSVLRERISYFGEIREMEKAQEFDYYLRSPALSASALKWKGEQDLKSAIVHLEKIISLIKYINTESANNIKQIIMPYAEEVGKGAVLWPLRMALSGKEKSPDPFTLIYILGVPESILRIEKAIALLK